MGYTYVLDEATQYPGVSHNNRYGVKTYYAKKSVLPRGLQSAVASPFTWESHVQNLLNNGTLEPNEGKGVSARNEYQQELMDAIIASYQSDGPGFVMSYPTGFGKTFVSIGAINEIKPTRVAVIAPLAYTDGWRSAIARAATGNTEWVVINPDRLTSMFRLPSDFAPLSTYHSDDRPLIAIDEGIPITQFDIVISDEAQTFAHIESQRTRLWQRLIGWNDDGSAPESFTLNLSATNWSTPAETVSAAHILAATKSVPVPPTLELEIAYDEWLRDNFGLIYDVSGGKWRWDSNIKDLDRLTEALYSKGLGASATRESLGMGEQVRTLHPIHLTASERALYPQSWRAFRAEWDDDDLDAYEPSDPRARFQRDIQKAALIKAPYVADLVVEYLEDGYQVIVPAWLGTTIDQLLRTIETKANAHLGEASSGRWAISLTGDDKGKSRDTKIRGFQGGFFPVIITSVASGISLHANQEGGGFKGASATSAPRVTIFGDVRWGGKNSFQAEGRGARDGEDADAIYCVAFGTAEVKAMAGVFRNLSNTKALAVDSGRALTDKDIAAFSAMADELEALDDEDTDD